MENSEKYHFSDFTTENYRRLLKLAKTNYTFTTYEKYSEIHKPIIWRHDVDFSMHRALKLAQIEKEEGIQSTYFILLHSEFYNALEYEISNQIKEISQLGHKIGLHFDSHYYEIKSENDLEDKLLFEKNILEKLFGAKIDVFSFHITNDFTMSCKREQYAGLINVYAETFQTEFAYCSDSNGYWRFNRLEDLIIQNTNNKLQVLTHPELWQDNIMSPKQRVMRCIEGRAKKTQKWYEDILSNNGRENIDW